MADNPTIVAASLSDDELKRSVNSLVSHVEEAMQKMVSSTNNAVGQMEAKLKSLGNIKVDSNGSADGGSSRRAKAQNAETDAIEKSISARDKQIKKNKEVEMSFDQMAKARQQAVNPTSMQEPQIKSARESYLAFVQGFKAQGEAIARQIKDAEAALNKAVENRVNELNTKLANAKARLNELNAELAKQRMNAERTGNYSIYNAGITRTTQAIEYQMKHIEELQRRISQVSPNMFGQQVQSINELRKEQERVANIMKEEVATKQQSTNATQQQVSAEQKVTDEIRRQAEEIRKSKDWRERGSVVVGGSAVYNPEVLTGLNKRQRQEIAPLEEQLLQIQQRQTAEQQRQAAATNETANAEQRVVGEAERRLQIEGSMQSTLQKSRDVLREMAAQKGGSVATFTPQLESIRNLNNKAKELKDRLNSMTFGERMSREGQQVAQDLRTITREAQKAQMQLSRPTSLKEVLTLPSKNLDDISYKIRQLQSYMRGLDATNMKSATEIRTVTSALEELRKKENDLLGKQAQLFQSNTVLSNSWRYMRNRLAFYFTVGASTAFVKNLIEVRSQYEMNEKALGILINSAERGTQIFNELSQMALVSPYTLIELSAAAKQLTAYDIAAKDVVNTTRRLADMAAAVGIPIERLTYALGQIKAYGYLNSRDNRMFANAGIPLVKQLADYYTELEGRLVSTADVYDRIKNKSVSYEDTMQVINKMTDEGGKFFDFQAKMADTLKVRLANLTLAWNNMLNEIGKDSQGMLTAGIGGLKELFLHWRTIDHILWEVVAAFGAYKAVQMLSVALTGVYTRALTNNILAQKRSIATTLQKKSYTETLTTEERRLIATQNLVTASDYRMALSSKTLTKQQAMFLVAMNRNNIALKRALIQMRILTAEEIRSITAGKMLSVVTKLIGTSLMSVVRGIGAFIAANPLMIALGVGYEIYHAIDSQSEHIKEINTSTAEHAKQTFDNLREYLASAEIQNVETSARAENLGDSEARKAWDIQREKIEEASIAHRTFIAELEKEEDVNKRLSQSFTYLRDIERVSGVIQNLSDDAIDVSQTGWGGLLGEGLKDDLKDYIKAYENFNEVDAEINQKSTARWENYWNVRKKQEAEFISEVQKTTNSIYDVASKENLNSNEQREFFERSISEVAQAEQMSIKETRLFRMRAEQEYYQYAKAQLESQLQYQQGRQKEETQARLDALDKEFNSNKAMQETFFAWLSEKHSSEVQKRLQNKTKEEIAQGTWLTNENKKWVEKMAQDFSREYNVSFDGLHKLVLRANTWTINIPVYFQSIGQSLSDIAKDYEARTGKKFSQNNAIKDAKTQVEIVKNLQDEQAKLAETIETARKAGGEYYEKNKKQWEAQNKSLTDDIHAYGALTKAEEKAQKSRDKSGGSKKDVLGDALTKEVQLIGEIQKRYKEYQQMGVNAQDAIRLATEEYGNTLKRTNATLAKYGISTKTSEELAGMDIRDVRDYYKFLLEMAKSTGNAKGIEVIEKALANINVEITKLDYKKITDGLNNELSKLKDEYELALELDANPELGGIFEQLFDIDPSQLPRTVQEYSDMVTKALNEKLREGEVGVELADLLGMRKGKMDEIVGSLPENSVWRDIITKAWKEIHEANKKAVTDAAKEWDKQVEKYGKLQDKLIRISKDGAQARFNVIKQFGSEEEKASSKTLIDNIMKEQDPQKIAAQMEELMKRVNAIIARNPNAKVVIDATINQTSKDISKAYWEDFKDSDLYSMTFENMSKNSTRAIQLIVDKLDLLKDKVKEDPASMKALTDSLNKAQDELVKRNPLKALVQSLGELKNARQGVKTATEALGTADGQVAYWEEQVKKLRNSGKDEKYIDAQDELAKAKEKQAKAQVNLAQAENKERTAKEKMVDSLNETQQSIEATQGAFNALSNAFRAFGDDDTADMLGEIANGFAMIIPAVIAVAVAIKTLESTSVILLAISAALAVIIGMVSWLSGNANKKITEQIEESEREVKKLENAYKLLNNEAEDAYGTMVMGARQAIKANKELQLAELKRQLALEQSRNGKHRDEDKIIELRGQIIDLEREVTKATEETLNAILGISSHGDFFEDLISSMIDAFKQGEDAMEVFEEKWDEMIDNMIMKTIVQRFLSTWVDSLEQGAEDIINKYTKDTSKEKADLASQVSNMQQKDAGDLSEWLYDNNKGYFKELVKRVSGQDVPELVDNPYDWHEGTQYRQDWFENAWDSGLAQKIAEAYYADAEGQMKVLDQKIADETLSATEDLIDYYGGAKEDFKTNVLPNIMEALKENFTFGQDNEKELSALQRGIQGISEDTAGALEAITNGISQQCYLQSDLLTQIRDTVQSFDIDVQTSTFAEMLLQLQISTQTQNAIRSIMEGWSSPNGMSVRVEMV